MSQKRPSQFSRRLRFALSAAMFVLSGPVTSGLILFNPVVASAAKKPVVQHVPVNICHATSSDTNPYVFLVVDDDSVKSRGHLMHRDEPNKTWHDSGTYNLKDHTAGDLKPDIIADYTDTDGVHHVLDGAVTEARDCPRGSAPVTATPLPTAAITSTCGKATVTMSNPEPSGQIEVTINVVLTITATNQPNRSITLHPGDTDSQDYVFTEDDSNGTVHIAVVYDMATLASADVDTDCVTPPGGGGNGGGGNGSGGGGTTGGGTGGGTGSGEVLGDATTPPVVIPSVPSVLAANTIAELPKTGSTNLPALVIALLGSVVGYEISRRKVAQSSL